MRRLSRQSTRAVAAAGLAITALTLSSCSSGDEKTNSAADSQASHSNSPMSEAPSKNDSSQDDIATIENAYVKSKDADESMTAVFGDIKNLSHEKLHLVGFSTNIAEKDGQKPVYEIHKTVNGKMMENKEGITLEPKGQHILQPGGDHLMIMNSNVELPVGAELDVTLNFDNGESVTLKDVPVRYQPAGEEDYVSGDDTASPSGEGMKDSHDMHEGHNH